MEDARYCECSEVTQSREEREEMFCRCCGHWIGAVMPVSVESWRQPEKEGNNVGFRGS